MAVSPLSFIVKRNDTLPTITVDVTDEAGDAVDFTDVQSTTFRMYTDTDDRTETVNASANIVTPATDGSVEYGWQVGDTADAGEFLAEFSLTFIDGSKLTVPHDGYIHVKVIPDLDDT